MSSYRGALRHSAFAAIVFALIGASLQFTPASAAPAAGWQPRPEDYANTVTVKDLSIPVSDGTVLRGDLLLPAGADGKAIAKRFPVVVTITAYNKSVQQYAGGLAGGDPTYLVKRGYAQLTVDARGTGSSGGTWCAFCTRENKDSAEIMTWAHQQSWSNGDTAMSGPSYMGINQIFAAAAKPAGLKALFPQVPGADVYRDVVASGGQLDAGFIPLWLGLVTATGLIPPAFSGEDPATALANLLSHVSALGTFTVPLLLSAVGGAEAAYDDGDFYGQRSPINSVSKVDVPTFFIGGEYDLFQRGTPLLYENLQKRGVPTKIIIGPWDHLQGSSGAEVGKAGLGSISELQLRWFDHYVKGMADPTLDSSIPSMTYYEQGTGAWKHANSWVSPDHTSQSWKLSGSAATLGGAGALTTGAVTDGTSKLLPIPVAGLCSRSLNQWTAGLPNIAPFTDVNPCLSNNALNDKAGIVFDSAPLTKAATIQGPINAHLYVSSTSGDGMLSVAVEDVAPDGTVSRLTGGWQVISLRQLTTSKSRYLDGKLIQPYHPYTEASKQKLAEGQVAPVDVEVFPTAAKIQIGHRLRIAIQSFDVPHLLPNLTLAADSFGTTTVHNSTQYPSELTLPVLSAGAASPSTGEPSVVVPDDLSGLFSPDGTLLSASTGADLGSRLVTLLASLIPGA